MTRRRMLLAGMAAVGTTSVAACVPGGGPPADAAKPYSPAGSVTVDFLSWSNINETSKRVTDRTLEAFARRYPQITVNFVLVPQPEAAVKLVTMAAAGTPPDAALLRPQDITPAHSQGVLAELDPFLKRDAKEVELDDFFPAALERATKNGKHFALPFQMAVLILIYNKSLFAQAGVKPPDDSWTWDTFTEAARRLTKRDVSATESGSETTQSTAYVGANQPEYQLPVWAWGGSILDSTERRLRLDEAPATSALQWWADLKLKHAAVPLPEDGQFRNEQDRFLAGRLAMLVTGSGPLANIELTPNAPPFDVAVVPKGPAKRATSLQGPSLSVAAAAKQKDAGWEWVKTFTGQEVLRFAATELGSPVARRSAVAAYAAQRASYNRRPVLDSGALGQSLPFVGQYAAMDALIVKALDQINRGQQGPQQAMSAIKPEIEALLAQGR